MLPKKSENFTKLKKKLDSVNKKNFNKEDIKVYIRLYKSNPESFFMVFPKISNETLAKKLILKIKPEIVVKYIKHLKKIKWIDKYLLKVVKNNSVATDFIENVKHFKEMPWAKKIVLKALPWASGDLFGHLDDLKGISWLPEALLFGADNCFNNPFRYFKKYKNFRNSKQILQKATKAYPALAIEWAKEYSGMSWRKEIMSLAIKEIKISEYSRSLIFKIDKALKIKVYKDLLMPFKVKVQKYLKIAQVLLKQQTASIIKYIGNNYPGFRTRAYLNKARRNLFKDPAIQLVIKISDNWISPKPSNERRLIQQKVMIARRLFLINKPVNKQNVILENKNILESRRSFSKLPLFKNRNVLFASHNQQNEFEHKKYGKYIFGKTATLEAIKRQGGNLTHIRASEQLAKLKQQKKEILSKVVSTPPPLTFYFDGHGGPKGLYLNTGQVSGGTVIENKNTVKITPAELARALKKRRIKYPKKDRPIFIFECCFNHTFLRNMYAELGESDKLPITIGIGEYDQLGWVTQKMKYNNLFKSKVLELGRKNYTSTIGSIMKKEDKGETNPSVYIPYKKRPMQIVKVRTKKTGRAKV